MARRAQSVASLAIALDRASPQPLYRQICQQLREIILSGRVAAGALLPSTRTLTRELEVSRTTLELAFDQLHADGYIEGRIGSGTSSGRARRRTCFIRLRPRDTNLFARQSRSI